MAKAPRRVSVWVVYKGRSSHHTGEICCFSSGRLGPFPASREDAVSGPAWAVSLFPNIHFFCVQMTLTSHDTTAGQTASYQVCAWSRVGRETRQSSKMQLSYMASWIALARRQLTAGMYLSSTWFCWRWSKVALPCPMVAGNAWCGAGALADQTGGRRRGKAVVGSSRVMNGRALPGISSTLSNPPLPSAASGCSLLWQ